MLDLNKLNTSECYCNLCIKEEIINPLKFDDSKQRFTRCDNPNHTKNNITLRYDKKENKWKTYMGYSKTAISLSESNTKTAKYMREHNLGLFNKEFHQKCIDTQIKNGTFNMLNPDFSKKHHEKMIKMKTGIFSDKNQKYIHSKEASLKRAIKANIPEYQAKRHETMKLLKTGIYAPGVREKGLRNGALNGPIRFKNENECKIHQLEKLSYWNGKKYVCWSCYKQNFDNFQNIILKDFILVPTFRSQESEDWSNSRQAFEQYLIDNNIVWFIYIKFYINKNKVIKPLVCGKSGSLLVNSSGSDISFSTDINDGPARRFLIENNYQWDKTKIAILKCNFEQEAYEKEKYYKNKFNLFGS